MGYATTSTGHIPVVTKSSSTRVLKKMNLNGWQAVLVQKEFVKVEKWVGLSQSAAEGLCASSETSILNNVTRQYLGGAKVSQGMSSLWDYDCWGNKVQTQIQKVGDSNIWEVTRTTTTLTVSTPSGTLELF